MAQLKNMEAYRKSLFERRDDLLSKQIELKEHQDQLLQPEIEPEEQASKSMLSEELFQVDEQERDEIEAIDRALAKIESGGFGICESCGSKIAHKRLDAIPWAPYCIRCAGDMEKKKEWGLI